VSRILIISSPCIRNGGAERWWYHVLNELKNTKISNYVVMHSSFSKECIRCSQALQSSNIGIICLKPRRNALWDMFLLAMTLVKIIKKKSIDLIVAGYQSPRIVLASLLAGIATRRKVFIVFHTPIGWLPYMREARLSKMSRLLIRLYKILNKHYLGYFIFCSPSVIYDLKRVHLNVARFCSVRGSAVEMPTKIAYKPYEERDIDIIYLASISKAKGVYDVLMVIKKVKEKYQNVKAVIIGKISNDLKKDLEDKILSHEINDNVKLLGYVDEIKKFELLSRSKVMVYPSYMDTFAIVVLEALSVGTPVVAYGIPAIKINYKTNAVISTQIGNSDEIAKKTLEILGDREYWKKLSKEAIIYSNAYNWASVAIDFLKCVIKGLRE
jgi:glycosyltransferase involved in cell wall biosynthesis